MANALLVSGAMAGLIAIAASGASYTITKIAEFVHYVTWKDGVTLVTLGVRGTGGSSVVLRNGGDGDIYITGGNISWRGGEYGVAANGLIRRGEFQVFDYPGPPQLPIGRSFLANESGVLPKKLYDDRDLWTGDAEIPPCITTEYQELENQGSYHMGKYYGRAGLKMVKDKASITFSFVSAETGRRLSQATPIDVTFLRLDVPECDDAQAK